MARRNHRLRDVQAVLDALAAGDLSKTVDDDGDDAIAVLGRGVDSAVRTIRGMVAEIENSVTAMRPAYLAIIEISKSLQVTAETTVLQTVAASAAAEQVAGNMQYVAAATEELVATVGEIASHAATASSLAVAASEHANRSSATAAGLAADSKQVTHVAKLIDAIASQTRLLALNARIEASRSSDEGRGFTVVAEEVKQLAGQTADATQKVRQTAGDIEAGSDAVSMALQTIVTDMHKATENQASIAAAAEQQTTSTSEISRMAVKTASDSAAIIDSIASIIAVGRQLAYSGPEAASLAEEFSVLEGRLAAQTARFDLSTLPELPVGEDAEQGAAAVAQVVDGRTLVKNSVVGAGLHEWDFSGSWRHSGDNEVSGESDSYSSMPGDIATLRFNGVEVAVYGITDTHHGMVAISVDGGEEFTFDQYDDHRTRGVLMWRSPRLDRGEHSLRLRVLATMHPDAHYNWVTLERAEVV